MSSKHTRIKTKKHVLVCHMSVSVASSWDRVDKNCTEKQTVIPDNKQTSFNLWFCFVHVLRESQITQTKTCKPGLPTSPPVYSKARKGSSTVPQEVPWLEQWAPSNALPSS